MKTLLAGTLDVFTILIVNVGMTKEYISIGRSTGEGVSPIESTVVTWRAGLAFEPDKRQTGTGKRHYLAIHVILHAADCRLGVIQQKIRSAAIPS